MKFFVLSFKRNILPIFFILFTICLVLFSKSNLTATKNGLVLWATCVVPSLFPFFVVTNLLTHTKVVYLIGKILDKFMRPIFNVPGIGGFAFAMGLISGYPVGAKIVSDLRQNNLVTKDEGERLLAFTNNSGPLFILSSVGISLFGDTKTGLLLLFAHILACITVGIIFSKFSSKSNSFASNHSNQNLHYINDNNNLTFKNLGEILSNSIHNSISTVLLIGGFVVMFSVIISILDQTNILNILSNLIFPILKLFNFNFSFAKPIISGIIELTNGINQVASVNIKAISQNVILSSFLLGFGGFSVLLQVYSLVSKTDLTIKKYFIGKVLQGIIASIYTFLALKLIPGLNLDIIETSNINVPQLEALNSFTLSIYSFFYSFGLLIIGICALFVIFNIFKKSYE